MKYQFKFAIGDWSDDGHGNCDYIHFRSNKSSKEIRAAYWESCCKIGVAFHDNDLTSFNNYNNMSKDAAVGLIKHRILHEYEDNVISKHVMEHFELAGIDKSIFQESSNEDGSQNVYAADELAELLLWFISKSLKNDFQYEIIEDEIECINGFWNKDLNVSIGYGIYY